MRTVCLLVKLDALPFIEPIGGDVRIPDGKTRLKSKGVDVILKS